MFRSDMVLRKLKYDYTPTNKIKIFVVFDSINFTHVKKSKCRTLINYIRKCLKYGVMDILIEDLFIVGSKVV